MIKKETIIPVRLRVRPMASYMNKVAKLLTVVCKDWIRESHCSLQTLMRLLGSLLAFIFLYRFYNFFSQTVHKTPVTDKYLCPFLMKLHIPGFPTYVLRFKLGERKTTVSCTKIMNKNISLVDNKKCKYLTKPEPQIRKCNEQPCQTR